MKLFVRIVIGVVVLSFCLTSCGTNSQSANINSAEESNTAYESNEKQETTDFDNNTEETLNTDIVETETDHTPEEALLGNSNAFKEFINANNENYNYETQIKNMVLALADAFNTAKLGTPIATASIHGLIPESVYSDKETLDEKMSAVYSYFVSDKLCRYFYLKFDSSGSITSVDITIDNLKTYVEDGISYGVFTGSWEEWDLNPQITSLEQFCEKMNITDEVAIAFFEIMESYDVSWLGGDSSSFLDAFID